METTMTAASARKKMPCPTEGVEQATLFSWASMRTYWHPELNLMFHIPNGGKRSKAEAGRFRAEGVKSGVPDICLPVARRRRNTTARRAGRDSAPARMSARNISA